MALQLYELHSEVLVEALVLSLAICRMTVSIHGVTGGHHNNMSHSICGWYNWSCVRLYRAETGGYDRNRSVTKCRTTRYLLLHCQGGWPPPPHLLTFASSLLPPLTTRDGTPSLYLTPNCGWSDLRWADTEWRLDKGNHPDSPGWSGRWLAAARLLSWGPGAAGPRGID